MTGMTSQTALNALTEWWEEMGVVPDPAIVRAFEQAAQASQRAGAGEAPPVSPGPARRKVAKPTQAWIDEARATAGACQDMAALAGAIEAFEGCPLKQGCRNTVVSAGPDDASIMVIGEGPGADEDRLGQPFVGRAGQLLDRMLKAISISRETNALITNVNYWRPPRNRNPEPDELAVCRPFVDRMIELVAPKLIIAAGAVPSQSLLASRTGIMRLRGSQHLFRTPGGLEIPLFPILHPAFLLRMPNEKSRAWRDLQRIETNALELGALD